MFALTVRDRMMIAHSFAGEAFGPAQRLHGATYVVDVTLWRPELNADGVVADIAAAGEMLSAVLGGLTLRNLDAEPAFAGINTTTEVLAKTVFDRLAARLREGALGADGRALTALTVTLNESDVASATYQGRLTPEA